MRYRNLGSSEIQVSEIGLGTWPAGGSILLGGVPTGYGDVPPSEASRAIERALDLGINFFDTSDSYGLGRSERILGKVVAGRRGQVAVATKAGWVPDGSERWLKDLSADHLRAAALRSRVRLGFDRLALLQLHAVPEEGPETDEALDALDGLKEREIIRLAGVSVGSDLEAGRRLVRTGRIDTIQVHFNLLQQAAASELFDEAREHGVGVIASIPLAYGFLSGRYTRATVFARDDWRSCLTRDEIAARIGRVEELRFLTGDGVRSLAQAAVQFVVGHPAVSVTIPGFRNEEQVEHLEAALSLPLLSDIELARARELGREWSRPVAADV
jgi:aryl-alcohol dehydrogenase-like predicted oxidoreductase